MKKFEEGILSDLRNLKPGQDVCLEEPESLFLDLLFKFQCIRMQKKQQVFHWFSVPHNRLFLDALQRDLKCKKVGLDPTTAVAGEPAMSFTYDARCGLYEQFVAGRVTEEESGGEGDLSTAKGRKWLTFDSSKLSSRQVTPVKDQKCHNIRPLGGWLSSIAVQYSVELRSVLRDNGDERDADGGVWFISSGFLQYLTRLPTTYP